MITSEIANNTAKQGGAGIFYLILDDILVLLLDFHYQIHDTFQFFHFFKISDFYYFSDFKMLQQNSYLQSIGVQSTIFPNKSVKSYLDFCIQIKFERMEHTKFAMTRP